MIRSLLLYVVCFTCCSQHMLYISICIITPIPIFSIIQNLSYHTGTSYWICYISHRCSVWSGGKVSYYILSLYSMIIADSFFSHILRINLYSVSNRELVAGVVCDLRGFLCNQSYPSPFKVICTMIVLFGAILSTEDKKTDIGGHDESQSNNYKSILNVLIACLAGSVLSIQALINARLGGHIGTTFHAVVSSEMLLA